MPKKSKSNRHLAFAREVARKAKIAKTNEKNARAIERFESIQLPPFECITHSSDNEEETDADYVIDGVHWRVLAEEPGDSLHQEDEDRMNRELLHENVAGNLIDCIEKLEKRWRAVGENFGFHGTSRSSFYRREKERNDLCGVVKDVRRMSTFFSKVCKVQDGVSLSEEIATCSLLRKKEPKIESPVYKYSVLEAMEQLKPLVANSRASSAPCNAKKPWEINRARAVFKYFTLLLEDVGKIAASAETALAFYPMKGSGLSAVVRSVEQAKTCYKARSVREWAEEYLITGEFPEFKQGEHAKTFSIINNEMNRAELTSQLRSWSDVDRTPDILMKHCNEPDGLLSKMNQAPSQISYSTAKRWMIELGFKPVTASKGWFTDAHERDDVVASRETFLKEMFELERRMCLFEGENMETRIEPDLLDGEKEVVLITHDESTFYCNEGRRFF